MLALRTTATFSDKVKDDVVCVEDVQDAVEVVLIHLDALALRVEPVGEFAPLKDVFCCDHVQPPVPDCDKELHAVKSVFDG